VSTSSHASAMGFAHLSYLCIHTLALDLGKNNVSGLERERRVSIRVLLGTALCNWRYILRTGDDEGLFEEALRHLTSHQRGGKGGYFS